jgi:DNA-binding GntR family transcriptional regulator
MSTTVARTSVTPRGTLTVEELYQTLRAEILHGELAAGSVVSQVKLAERLGVNRTPLREALRMLQRESLIESEHNRRVRVAELTSTDLVQLYAMRITQESLAVKLTVPMLSPAELNDLRGLLGEMDRVASPETFSDWEHFHRQFHLLLVSHAGKRITSAVSDLGYYCERYRRALLQMSPIGFGIGAREHASIVRACEAKDADQAAIALGRHLGRTALTLISVTDPSFDPRPVREALRFVIGDSAPPTPLVPDASSQI